MFRQENDSRMIKTTKNEMLTHLLSIKSELAQDYAVTQIGIFGSVAKDEDHQNSDVDVVVQMSPELLKRARLKSKLEKLFGKKVDVVRYRDSMNPYLKARIEQDVIYV